MYTLRRLLLLAALMGSLSASQGYEKSHTKLPELTMPQNSLAFREIEGFEDYKIVATHFRTDKNEIRYILANPAAYNALRSDKLPLPDGSKVVKVGWSVKKMELFPDALEADQVQRVEYMVKDRKRFNENGDHWGYARFVKKNGRYQSWTGGTQGCVSCHAAAKSNDFLFTTFQKSF